MRKTLPPLFVTTSAVLLGMSGAAQATPVVTSEDYEAFAGTSSGTVIDFDHALPAGFTITGGLQRTQDDGLGAPPAIAPGVKDSSMYWSVNPGDVGTILSTVGYSSVSFLWGSIDWYNTVSLLGADGAVLASYSGLQVAEPGNGDQYGATTNRRVTFTTDATTGAIYGLRLESSSPAFEIDDVAFSGPVPEPATWAMMVLGFGVVGLAIRSRGKRSRLISAA